MHKKGDLMVKYKDYVECMEMLGFKKHGRNVYCSGDVSCVYKESNLVIKQKRTVFATSEISRALKFIDFIWGSRVYKIGAAINTRNLAQNLIRVRSSNVWAVGFNPKKDSNKTGDLVMQFKNPNGGGGDTYIYYDVPVQTYRRLVSASSVGHAFWVLVRDNFNYSKLSGDRRGKLPNAINN